MFTLVIGGSSSGKSEYAENLTVSLDGSRIYLAAMQPFGAEAAERIRRHRSLRASKGFQTLEWYTDAAKAPVPQDGNVLLEDLGNLLANELYSPEGAAAGAANSVLDGVLALAARCLNLTVVTNEISSAGADYDPDTLRYMEVLGRINCCLAAKADLVVEVICGIPQIRKPYKGVLHVDS